MRSSRWLLTGGVAVLAAIGCTKLIGISGDYSVGGGDGAAPADDSGPDSGPAGAAGSAGSGADA